MDRREKQRKFHQGIIDMLYPPPTRHHHQEEEDEDPRRTTFEFDLNHITDQEFDSPSSSSSDDVGEEGEPGPHKLTRAQRKRLRNKKLKELASSAPQRREIIGPLLPSDVNTPDEDTGSFSDDGPASVRRNAAENYSQNTPPVPDPEDCILQKPGKLKRRRMAKKVARGNMRPSHLDECVTDGGKAKE